MRTRLAYLFSALPVLAAVGLGTAAAAGAGGGDGVAGAPAPATVTDPNAALRCVAATDAAGIDAILRSAGSPLAGDGEVFVSEGVAAGIDPRAVVAIAAHETLLETYGPAARIGNPFGLGPGMVFADDADAVRYAVRLLRSAYVAEGRTTLPLIGSKWAPVGAANDPQGLNAHWNSGVGRYYAALGGDPYRPILLSRQDPSPACAPAPGATGPAAAALRPGTGIPQVVVWGGNAPAVSGDTPADGADPAGSGPARPAAFAFPVAVPADGQVAYAAPDCAAAPLCAVTVRTAARASVVAATDGRLVAATPSERADGVAFWIVRPDGDRIGYGPLASYAPGISHDATVALGQLLGQTTGAVAVAWTRSGAAVNPFPLLRATRPPAA